MALKQTLVIFDALDSATVTGHTIAAMFEPYTGHGVTVEVTPVNNEPPGDPSKSTDFITIVIEGTQGRKAGGQARTLGIIGRNGAIGARPAKLGMVSDADGPIGALAAALKLAQMKANGDALPGDVIVTTHLSTDAPMSENNGVPFMGMPVSSATMNQYEVAAEMDAILSLDASKGNRIIKQRGFALSPTAMQGYILRMAPDLVAIMESTTGQPAVTFPISLQDITPYDNGLSHFNSIMQPHVATDKPVVGVAITARSVVGGSDSSASHEVDIAEAVRFSIEVAKRFTSDACEFFDATEWQKIHRMYPDLSAFQGYGNAARQ
ncbi:DUF1177 domain-containing protein [Paraburkholderia caffeinilytica]|uniref:DUF1177 domain-containing protein n=1 Tax=Paraburkholderia caffeinilytica TaxID=1761016 RepID=UPI0038B8773D